VKWLKRISIVIGVLIAISITANVVMSNILNDRVIAAHESGSQEGYAQGYVVGNQEGTTVGYQEGGRAGYQAGSTTGYEKGGEEGYNSGYKAGFEEGVGAGYIVRNPTYNEVQEILTDGEATSAWELNNHAEAKGFRAAYVQYKTIYSATKGEVYELVAFETIDKGLIFVEPSSHKEVKLEVGKHYSGLNELSPPDYDDTITKIRIIW